MIQSDKDYMQIQGKQVHAKTVDSKNLHIKLMAMREEVQVWRVGLFEETPNMHRSVAQRRRQRN